MIIASITEKVGEENVKAVMQTMVGGLDCCDTIEELIDSAISINEFEARPKKKESKLAAMMANSHQDEKYNHLTKEWEKI